MDLALSENQEILKTMARKFLTGKLPKASIKQMEESETGYSQHLWQEMSQLGWMGLPFPEEYFGSNMTFLDLSFLLEEMGRACLPGPYIPTVILGGLTMLEIGSDGQKTKFLPEIASGRLIFTLALTEANDKYFASAIKTQAAADGNEYVINGTKLFVPYAHVADYMLCVARTNDRSDPESALTIFILDSRSPGIDITVLSSIANDKLCEVAFNNVRVPKDNILGEPGQGWPAIKNSVEQAAVAKCCEMVGYIEAVLDMTVNYAKERKQHNRPIGSFQAIQHYCADMATDVDSTRLATYQAAWMISEELPCTREVSIAKAWAGESCQRVIALAHQIHGAIGITMDHDLHYYTRRVKAAEIAFGDAKFFRELISQELEPVTAVSGVIQE